MTISLFHNRMKVFVSLLLAVAGLLCAPHEALSASGVAPRTPKESTRLSDTEETFRKLDATLQMSETFVNNFRIRVTTVENMLHSRGVSLEQQFEIYGQLYHAYASFQFNKAAEALDNQLRVAEEMHSPSKITDVLLNKAMLHTVSGLYLEARVTLGEQLDTLAFNEEQRRYYHLVQHRFHDDFSNYTNNQALQEHSRKQARYYRTMILAETHPDETLHRTMLIKHLAERGEHAQAEQIALSLVAQFSPDSHEYAIYAYELARICEALSRPEEMRLWLARSAIADIMSATKDHASLCSLAQELMRMNDIERAFSYITCSLNDALFFNAKLRPFQIAGIIPAIEAAYQQMQREQEQRTVRYLWVISLLATALLVICLAMIRLYRHAHVAQREIEQMNARIKEYNESLSNINAQLQEVNNDLSEANAVKEEYIGLFLTMCSNYIDKLIDYQRNVKRKLTAGKIVELKNEISTNDLQTAEVNNFYEVFDHAFLQLYPDFVEEFNRLLKPEARIVVKKGLLNTEMRIFALIRLGITDSSRIAALLRYSVNTIYNYRARTKNNALGDRDRFEDDIRAIHR